MSHLHDTKANDGSLKFGLVVKGVYTVVEFGFGIATSSLAL